MTDRSIEERATYIIETLNAHQYEAYWVGGFVRDRLLGRETQDIDIASSAKPEQVMSLFERCKPTGLQHGTVLVIVDGTPFEVTTFREESGYDNYRRPTEVTFIQDIQGDLSRRDFTINAMAIDRSGAIIDPYGGQDDLHHRILRCVGDAHVRFGEDALRMMRCIRFAAEYDLFIEELTWDALLKQAPLLTHIAMERIRVELERIVGGNHCGRGLHLFVDSGLFRHFKSPVDIDFELLTQIEQKELTEWLSRLELNTRFALLFLVLGISSDRALTSLRALTFANQSLTAISELLSFHEWFVSEIESPSKRSDLALIIKLGTLKFGMEVSKQWLHMITEGRDWIMEKSPYTSEWLQVVSFGERWLLELPVVCLQDLQISGSDVVKVGCVPGPRIGQVLNMLLEETALGLIDNDKKQLMLRARKLVAEKSERDE
ncbi:MAG: CCA tRNA nucleotidyltransferase [Paenibacillaceae bacterium]